MQRWCKSVLQVIKFKTIKNRLQILIWWHMKFFFRYLIYKPPMRAIENQRCRGFAPLVSLVVSVFPHCFGYCSKLRWRFSYSILNNKWLRAYKQRPLTAANGSNDRTAEMQLQFTKARGRGERYVGRRPAPLGYGSRTNVLGSGNCWFCS